MSDYALFAPYYDLLMFGAEYNKRAEYLLELFRRLSHNPGITLDVACGTGTVTLLLKQKGVDIYGVDSSEQMLSVATEKASEAGEQILYLCQKIQNLNLYGTIQTAICTLDGLNHLHGEKEVVKALEKIGFFMDKGGYFVFDMNTVYKHTKVLKDNTFVYETDEVFCVWQNSLNEEKNKVSISLDFFTKENSYYKRESTNFSQWAYSVEKVEEMLQKAGFKLRFVYDDLTFDKPKTDSQRIICVAQKYIDSGERI